MPNRKIGNIGLVFVAYGHGYAREAIASALETAESPIHYIIVDNSPRWTPPIDWKGLQHSVVHTPEAYGYAHALNHGASYLTGDYIILCNDDLIFREDGWDTALLNIMESTPDIGMIGPLMLDKTDHVSGGPITGTFQSHAMPSWGHLPSAGSHQFEVPMLQGSFMMLRHPLFRQLNGMDNEYRHYFEDDDLSLRVWEHGYKVVWTDATWIEHTPGSSRPKEPLSAQYFKDGKTRYNNKHVGFLRRERRYFKCDY